MVSDLALAQNWARHTTKFKDIASKITQENFLTYGVSAITKNQDTVSDFWQINTTWMQDEFMASRSGNIMESQGGVLTKFMEYGNTYQRVFMESRPPEDAQYVNLQENKSVDMQVVRKPIVEQRFLRTNANYYNHMTLPGTWATREIIMTGNGFGLGIWLAGVMEGMEAEWNEWNFSMETECFYAGTHDSNRPLLQSQTYQIPNLVTDPSTTNIYAVVGLINKLVNYMTDGMRHNGYNSFNYRVPQEKGHLALYVRTGFKAMMGMVPQTVTATTEPLALPVRVIELPHFGGGIPYTSWDEATNTYTGRLYPVYGSDGAVIGYAPTEGAATATVQRNDPNIAWYDPDPATGFWLMDDRCINKIITNKREILAPPFNTTGLYQNYDDVCPNMGFVFDAAYNHIRFVYEGMDDPTIAAAVSRASAKARKV